MSTEIVFNTENLTVDRPSKYSTEFRVTANIDESELFAHFSGKEVAEYVSHDTLLDAIGEDYARQYFGIEPDAE